MEDTTPAKDAPPHTAEDTNTSTTTTPTPPQPQPQQEQQLSPSATMLKEAFPTVDTDVIEAILDSHQGNVERSFEDLLRMSDPDYRPEPPRAQAQEEEEEATPTMPPRPSQQQQQPVLPEEQMRLDEEYAKQLALEDERQRVRQHQSRQQQQQKQQQQQPGEGSMDEFIKDIQEELPIIKERMIEAGNAAKKKVMDWYNQVKTNRTNESGFNSNINSSTSSNSNYAYGARSSMPTSNAQYRGLPSDRDDDYLLSGDMSALHLSDHDVYAQTKGAPPTATKNFYDYQGSDFDATENVIHVNPPPQQQQQQQNQAQILADEEFARQLAQDDEMWRQRQQERETPTRNSNLASPRVIVAPRSPLEEYDEQDNRENVPLNAYSRSGKQGTKKDDEPAARSYVIGDYDDSDDGLVDLEDDDDEDPAKLSHKPDEKTSPKPTH